MAAGYGECVMSEPMTKERLEYWRNCFAGLFSIRRQIAEVHDLMREELTVEIDRLRAERAEVAGLLERAMVRVEGLSRHAPIEMRPTSRVLAEELREAAARMRGEGVVGNSG